MAESKDRNALAKSDGDDLLAAARLADVADDYEREAHRRLVRAVTTTVLGPAALGLFVILRYDAATSSAVVFLVVLLLLVLGITWGQWWLFMKVHLDDVRQAVAEDRILGRVSGGGSEGEPGGAPDRPSVGLGRAEEER